MTRFRRAGGSEDGRRPRATTLELFYDLVFVFAITQVSHLLLANLTWEGVGQSAIVLLAVWWSWNYATWATNELDPDSLAVRLLVIAIMLGSLVMAVAIPDAFGERAILFAGAYVAIHLLRQGFLTFAAADRGTLERERAGRILTWFVASGVLWVAGGLADGSTRTLLWIGALVLDYAAPLAVYRVPFRRPLAADAWNVETSHFAERFQLFVIIALGESIVITGATISELDLDLARLAALGVAFLGSAALWWLYFDYVAEIAERRLAQAQAGERTRLARDAYTYLHVVIVAGVIVTAVGDELVIAHPDEALAGREVAAVVGGPAIYLLAHVLFRLRLAGSVSRKRLGGAAACVAVGLAGAELPALAVGAAVVAVLAVVIGGEQAGGRRRRARGELSPLERLDAANPETKGAR